jgi:ABC transporter
MRWKPVARPILVFVVCAAPALVGIDPADTGTITLNGRPVRLPTPQAAARTGIALLPGNRKAQGVFGIKSIAFNISVAHLHLLRRLRPWVDRRREQQVATDLIKRIAIKAPGPQTPVNALSGGNQQKVVLARQLVERPGVLSTRPLQDLNSITHSVQLGGLVIPRQVLTFLLPVAVLIWLLVNRAPTAAQFASARPDAGTVGNGMALPAITIAVLGGVAIAGGGRPGRRGAGGGAADRLAERPGPGPGPAPPRRQLAR